MLKTLKKIHQTSKDCKDILDKEGEATSGWGWLLYIIMFATLLISIIMGVFKDGTRNLWKGKFN